MKTMAKLIVAGLLLVVMICAAFTSCAEKKDGIQLIYTKAGEHASADIDGKRFFRIRPKSDDPPQSAI